MFPTCVIAGEHSLAVVESYARIGSQTQLQEANAIDGVADDLGADRFISPCVEIVGRRRKLDENTVPFFERTSVERGRYQRSELELWVVFERVRAVDSEQLKQ